MALQALIEMGADALPAREMVRFAAEHGDGAEFSDAQIDQLRLGALSALHAMRAPETEDLLRAKIVDPEFVTRDSSYAALLEAAGQVGIGDDTLTGELRALMDTAPEHAERLMTLEALRPKVQAALDQAVFEAPHGDPAIRHFLARMPELPFLDDAERVRYVVDNLEVPGLRQNQGREALAAIGSEPALDAALAIAPPDGAARYHLIASFAEGPMTVERVADRLLTEAGAVEGAQEIDLVIGVLEGMLREGGASIFSDAMRRLIETGPTEAHMAVGVQRQVRFLQRNADADAAAALRPVFALLDDPAIPPAVRVAADVSLRQAAGRLAEMEPDYFIDAAVNLIWRATGPAEAELPVALLSRLMSSADLAPRVVDVIDAQYLDHMTDWSINAATAIAIGSGTTRGLERSPTREAAAIMMGKAIESPAIDLEYLGPQLARNGAALANLEANTVAGVIGTYAPMIFAEDKPDSYSYSLEAYLRPMLMRPDRFAHDPEAKAEWLAFLQRVVDLDDENFSPTARRARDAF